MANPDGAAGLARQSDPLGTGGQPRIEAVFGEAHVRGDHFGLTRLLLHASRRQKVGAKAVGIGVLQRLRQQEPEVQTAGGGAVQSRTDPRFEGQ
ncbi:MAG: hypothetical protein ACK55H_09785, partial [Cyanobacteriota bacterium]